MWAINNARQNGLDISFKLVYTGRSDDPTLEQTLFADLQISQPDVYLGVDCDSLNELTGRVMAEFERYLAANKTDVVIVVDDLASTMAVAIVTKKCGKHTHGHAPLQPFTLAPASCHRQPWHIRRPVFTVHAEPQGIACR